MVRQRQLRSSFYGKEETEVAKLVAGAQAYICDECVTLASQIMADDTSVSPGRKKANRPGGVSLWSPSESFCGNLAAGS